LEELHPDVVHIFAKGRILESGGPELAERLEVSGYSAWVADLPDDDAPGFNGLESERPKIEDPFFDL
ncbi:MAG TPA: hypothetical protein PLS63_05365, partial [Microthrixaceae bacterium]|nr:hypothetical protein [Microthrixaceae bacterium]